MTNDPETSDPSTAGQTQQPATGAGASHLHILSDADLALASLLAWQVDLSGETQLSLDEAPRQPVPQALLAMLMTTNAIRLAGVSALTPALSVSLRFIEQAYTDEELRFVALAITPGAADALAVRLRVESADARPLAEGEIYLATR